MVFVSVGTGIAPFRSFIHHLENELNGWKGKILLFSGSRTSADNLYLNNINNDLNLTNSQKIDLEIITALSREEIAGQSKAYVQHKMLAEKEKIKEIFSKGNCSFYVCGLKGMEAGVNEAMAEITQDLKIDWESFSKDFKKAGRWNIEVY